MNKNAPEIFTILFNAVIQGADMSLIKKAQHALLELPTAFAGNNLHQLDTLLNGFLYNAIEFDFDLVAVVINIVQV